MKKPASTSISVNSRPLELPEIEDQLSLQSLRPSNGLLSRLRAWFQARRMARSDEKRLRVAETVSLGEKRFVAVVQVDGRHFLVAGGPTNIVLLAQLDPKDDFQDVLKKTMTVPLKAPAKGKRPAGSVPAVRSSAAAPSRKKARTNTRKPERKPTKTPGASSSATANTRRTAPRPPIFNDLMGQTMATAVHLKKAVVPQNGKHTPEQVEEFS